MCCCDNAGAGDGKPENLHPDTCKYSRSPLDEIYARPSTDEVCFCASLCAPCALVHLLLGCDSMRRLIAALPVLARVHRLPQSGRFLKTALHDWFAAGKAALRMRLLLAPALVWFIAANAVNHNQTSRSRCVACLRAAFVAHSSYLRARVLPLCRVPSRSASSASLGVAGAQSRRRVRYRETSCICE